ncbi:MAG: tandem-95 repeat protein, partial [Ramlibacter sp.]|nr:tandem-95 repeat protein [Ramlibacter sp.]
MLLSWLRRPKPSSGRIAPEAEWLEPRLLYSADLAVGLLPAAVTADNGEIRTLTQTGEYATTVAPTQAQAIAQAYAVTALNFERNDGQETGTAEFVARGSGYAIGLAAGNVEIALTGASTTVGLQLVDANPGIAAQGEGLLQARSNYLVGNDRSQWRTDIPNYAAVRYDGVWDGIDVRYYGNQRQLEYDFIVAAGADAAQIQLRFHGADASLDADGNLVLKMADGRELRFAAPISYQEGPAGREAVRSSYDIHADGSVGFQLGDHDHGRALVIDPVLNYATYFGGSGTDVATDAAVDALGNVYITGYTTSTNGILNVPILGDILGSILGGTKQDVFVAKFNADLSQLLFLSRVGGGDDDQGLSITVNAANEAIVTGVTKSADFTITAGANDTTRGGTQDAFLFKLKNDFSDLWFSTFVGDGTGNDIAHAVALDSAGNIYIAGAATAVSGSGTDAWLAKYSGSGAFLAQLKYGGTGANEYATDLALDSADNIYIVGNTDSAGLAMPNGLVPLRPGKKDAFLLRYDSSFILGYGTYVGGDEDDSAAALAVDDNGRAYVVGQTNHSDSSSFQTTAGALRTVGDAKQTGYLMVFDTYQAGAGSLVYSTLATGSKKDDGATGVALAGNRVVVVSQSDSDNSPVTTDAAQSSNSGKALYIAVIAPQGRGLLDLQYGTYYGSNVMPGFVTVAPLTQRLYVAASTNTSGLAKPGAADTSANGGTDSLVVELTLNFAPVLTGANALPAVVEDQANAGALVSSLIAGKVTDADANALRGIAVTSADNANGVWQYALDGTTWVAVGSPSIGSALLLPADGLTRVRFVPAPNLSGTADLVFRAWDRTSGSIGGNASTLVNGLGSAFSSAQATSTVAFISINDAPVLTGGTVADLNTREGTTSLGLAGINYAPGDADESGQVLTYTVTEVPVASVGRITLAAGATVAAGSSYTLAELQGMKFVAATGVTFGTGLFSFNVVDNGGTANGGINTLAQSLTITVTNEAPVLTGPITFTSMLEDGSSGAGTLVSDLIAGRVADAGGLLGIAVTDQSSPSGSSWEYTRNGGLSWLAMNSSLAESRATLLAADGLTRIRYVPAANWSGTGTLTFRAWDQSGGTAGSTQADVRVNGGSTPFSGTSSLASISVLPVNDQPVRNGTSLAARNFFENSSNSLGLGSLAYDQGGGPDEDPQVLTYTITDLDGVAAIGKVTLSNGTAVVAGSSYTLAQLQGLRFVVAPGVITGSGTFTFDVRDNGGTANGGNDTLSESLKINVFNRAPTLNGANPMPTIAEDPAVNNGIRVADLVAGQISDPNGGYGIAVVAAAHPNGSWQYSRDDGATWNAFGAIPAGDAILFAADSLNRVRFAPAPDWNGTATGLSFRAWDQSGGTAGLTSATIGTLDNSSPYSSTTAAASVTITPVDDPTTVIADTKTVAEDNPASGNVLANDTDIDTVLAVASYRVAGNATVFPAGQGAVIAGTGNFTLAANGNYNFTPLPNWNGAVPVVSYTTNSGVIGTLSITVTSVNDLPVATPASVSGLEDAAFITITLAGSDVDGSIASFTLQNLPANGQLYRDPALTTAAVASTAYATGVFYFRPNANFNGT